MSFGNEPPRLGRIAGGTPVVAATEAAAQHTHGWSGSSRVAGKQPFFQRSSRTIGKPCASRWRRKAGRKFSGSVPTTKRIWQVALARGGIALTGFSGLPVEKARTSKLHQPNTFSAPDRPGSVDLGGVVTAVDRDVGECRAHRIGDRRRQPFTHLDGAGWRGDRRQRLRQDDAGVA